MPFMNISRSLILSVNAVDCSYSLCRHYSKKVIYSEKFNSDIISQKSVHAANRTCNIFAENTQIITCCPDNIFSRSKCGSNAASFFNLSSVRATLWDISH